MSVVRRAPLLRASWRALAPLIGLLLAGALVAAALGSSTPAQAAPAPSTSGAVRAEDPPRLALPWGVYTSKYDEAYGAWSKATGTDKTLLAKIALRPRVRWFGSWNSTTTVAQTIRNYVAATQNGDPNALVQFATFRLWPHNGEAGKDIALTAADRDEYRAWVRQVARGIGTARVAIVLEPDLAVALGGPNEKYRMGLTNYAARVFGAMPNVSTYIDASDADWLSVERSVAMLKAAGVQHVRGIALGATHYYVLGSNRLYAGKVIAALAKGGISGKKAVIDTADNGKGFTWSQYYADHPRPAGDFDNAETCTSTTAVRCVTLGVPPTPNTKVADIDGYLWFGRPWLYRQASPFKLDRALAVAHTTPY